MGFGCDTMLDRATSFALKQHKCVTSLGNVVLKRYLCVKERSDEIIDRIVLNMCHYDIETAEAMLATKRYLYVGFMCHLVAEKALKAYWSEMREDQPQRTHNLRKLANLTGLEAELSEEQLDYLASTEPFNIEGRYTEYKQQIAQTLSAANCEVLLAYTKSFELWIENKLLPPCANTKP